MIRTVHVLWHKTYSWCCETYLGIGTRGMVAAPNAEGVHYTPLPYPLIHRMLDALQLESNDVFADIRCGKGRVACCVSRLPIRQVVAIELNTELLDTAKINLERVRGRQAPAETFNGSAELFDYTGVSVAYLYNPFNARVTEEVVSQLARSRSAEPRLVRIVYANPVHENVLRDSGWLEKYDEWPAIHFPVFGYPVSFWRSR